MTSVASRDWEWNLNFEILMFFLRVLVALWATAVPP